MSQIIESEQDGVSDFISQALSTFDDSRRAIAAVQSYGEFTVAEDGIGRVTEARKAVKRLRIDIDKRRKELNEGALKYQRSINEEAKRLIAEIEPIEGKLSAEEENYEAEKARQKQAEERAKQEKLQSRLDRLALAGCPVANIASVQQMDDEFFEHYLRNEAVKVEHARLEQQRQAEELRIARERLEAEREALRKQQEEVAQQQAEIRRKQIEEQQEAAAKQARERLAAAKAAEEARIAALQPEIDKARTFGQSMITDATDELNRIGNPWWSHKAKRLIECFCGDLVNIVAAGEHGE